MFSILTRDDGIIIWQSETGLNVCSVSLILTKVPSRFINYISVCSLGHKQKNQSVWDFRLK